MTACTRTHACKCFAGCAKVERFLRAFFGAFRGMGVGVGDGGGCLRGWGGGEGWGVAIVYISCHFEL